MKTLPSVLSFLAAAFVLPSVVFPQIVQVDKPVPTELGRKKSAPKRARPKPRAKATSAAIKKNKATPDVIKKKKAAPPDNGKKNSTPNAENPPPNKSEEPSLASFSAKGLNYETELK